MADQKKAVSEGMGALRTLLGERWREISLLGALLGSLFALVALIGFEPTDPTWLHPNTGRVANPCGPLGALLADGLFQLLGVGAWATFGCMVVCVLALAGRPVFHLARWLNGFGLFVSAMALLHLAFAPWEAYPPGGWVGQTTAEALAAVVGTVGSLLVLGGLAGVTLTLLFNIRWSAVAGRLVEFAEARWPAVRDVLHSGAEGAGARARGGVVALWSGLWGSVRTAASSAGGFSGRVARSFRTEVDDVLEPADDLDFLVPSESIATAASVPMVAEVQWEPTVADPDELRDIFTGISARDVSTGGSIVGPGAGSQVQPQPIAGLDRTQPGQISLPPAEFHTVASAPDSDPASDPSEVGRAVPAMSFGETLTPPDLSADPVPAATPRPISQRRVGVELGVELAAGMDAPVDDDGGQVRKPSKRGWKGFQLPKLSLLDIVPEQHAEFDGEQLRALAARVEEVLLSFNIEGEVTNVRVGPVVTTFEYLPGPGIKVAKIAGLSDDLAMGLKATSVRIVAPIPGKGVVGIEIPSPKRLNIYFRELLASDAFRKQNYELPVALGKDVEGKPIIANLVKMPHLLVAGTTGAGKSVGVNGMLVTLLFTCTPEDMRLLLIDPKQLEFKMYDAVPHLLHPVVTDPKKASAALDWAVREMEERYSRLAAWNTRNIVSYNEKVEKESQNWTQEKARRYAPKNWDISEPLPGPEKMPFIVIVIDELADLMMVAKKEIEQSIARLAQKARACGIHLILATQRPSADVVTGLIKSNMPTRIAFKLKSALDSRVILDENGAERLLGRGDMLHSPNGGELERVHGAFVSDEEVERVCDYLRTQGEPQYIDAITAEAVDADGDLDDPSERDPLFNDSVDVVLAAGKASTSMIQRALRIGYNRAARIVDQLEAAGVVGPADGARPREVLVSDNAF